MPIFALPDGDVVVSAQRLAAEPGLVSRTGRLGVRCPNDQPLDAIVAHLDRLARIELEFPKFTDGRSYTLARRLREVHGYGGELVAVGDVLRDQLLYMLRCGFSAFELAPGTDATAALRAFDETSAHYQAACDLRLPLWKRVARPPA